VLSENHMTRDVM